MSTRRMGILLLTLPALVAVFAVIAVGFVLARPLAPAPFAYLDAAGRPVSDRVTTYAPDRAAVCPGDTFHVPVAVDVIEVPVVIEVFSRFLNVRTGRTMPGYGPLQSPVPYASPSHTATRLPVVVPLTYAPGPYVFEVVARAEGRLENAFRVPFIIRADCARNR